MGQRTVGATMLAAGLGGVAVVVLADVGMTALVVVAAVSTTGLLMLRPETAGPPSILDDGPDGPPFAMAIDEDGQPVRVARGEVEAVFESMRDRWRGVQALRLGDDAEGPPASLGAAVVELRADILRAEVYLDALRFRQPEDRRPYDAVVAELEELLRRVGDPGWGRRPSDG